jgi:hypothetical protein
MTKSWQHNYDLIPERMMESVKAYIRDGRPTGQFLQAIICNDLLEACGRADDENIRIIPIFVSYFYNEAPSPCWGSKEAYVKWVNGELADFTAFILKEKEEKKT